MDRDCKIYCDWYISYIEESCGRYMLFCWCWLHWDCSCNWEYCHYAIFLLLQVLEAACVLSPSKPGAISFGCEGHCYECVDINTIAMTEKTARRVCNYKRCWELISLGADTSLLLCIWSLYILYIEESCVCSPEACIVFTLVETVDLQGYYFSVSLGKLH